jgi:hypothetical protein
MDVIDAVGSISGNVILALVSVAIIFGLFSLVLYQARVIVSLLRRLVRGFASQGASSSDSNAARKGISEDAQTDSSRQGSDSTTVDDLVQRLRSGDRSQASAVPDDVQYEVLSDILRRYHSQSLEQSKVSFLASLVFASLGFLIIASAIFTIQRDRALGQQSAAVIPILAGAIIDLVASLFFVQSRRAQLQSQQFFDRLRHDRKLEKSLELAANISDPEVQSKLQALLALHLAEVETANAQPSSIFGTSDTTSIEALQRDQGVAEERKPRQSSS